jgi:hypothetical protein
LHFPYSSSTPTTSVYLFLILGKDKLGVSSNNGDTELAVSYSVAGTRVDTYYAQNTKDFKSPQIVNKLPQRVSLNTGESYTPEVVQNQGNNDYYDGGKKLHLRAY